MQLCGYLFPGDQNVHLVKGGLDGLHHEIVAFADVTADKFLCGRYHPHAHQLQLLSDGKPTLDIPHQAGLIVDHHRIRKTGPEIIHHPIKVPAA